MVDPHFGAGDDHCLHAHGERWGIAQRLAFRCSSLFGAEHGSSKCGRKRAWVQPGEMLSDSGYWLRRFQGGWTPQSDARVYLCKWSGYNGIMFWVILEWLVTRMVPWYSQIWAPSSMKCILLNQAFWGYWNLGLKDGAIVLSQGNLPKLAYLYVTPSCKQVWSEKRRELIWVDTFQRFMMKWTDANGSPFLGWSKLAVFLGVEGRSKVDFLNQSSQSVPPSD